MFKCVFTHYPETTTYPEFPPENKILALPDRNHLEFDF